MTEFSLESVRETFSADMNLLVGRVAEATLVLGNLPSPQKLEGVDARGRSAYQQIEDSGHAMAGTAGLVGALGLQEAGNILEELAAQGREALAQAQAQLDHAVKIAQTCKSGIQILKTIVDHELSGERTESQELSEQWTNTCKALLKVTETEAQAEGQVNEEQVNELEGQAAAEDTSEEDGFQLADDAEELEDEAGAALDAQFEFAEDGDNEIEGEDDAGFGFGEETEQAAAESPAEVEIEDELLGIFQEEGREAILALKGHLQTLWRNPSELTALRHAERLYHTLKGAAATVGLVRAAEVAATMQKKCEEALEGRATMDQALLENLREETNALCRATQLDEMILGDDVFSEDTSRETEASDDDLSPQAAFQMELEQYLEEGWTLLRRLSTASQSQQREIFDGLHRIFHTLKGSALILGLGEIANCADTLQEICASGLAPSAAELETGLKKLAKLGGVSVDEPAVVTGLSEESKSDRKSPRSRKRTTRREAVSKVEPEELWEAFHEECQELMEAIDKQLVELDESSDPRKALNGLMRLFHTLKGSVNTVGLAPTGKVLHLVEDFLEGLETAPIIPPSRKIASLLLDVQSEVRGNIKQSRNGYVVVSEDWKERVVRVMEGGTETQESSVAVGGSLASLAPGSFGFDGRSESASASALSAGSYGTESSRGTGTSSSSGSRRGRRRDEESKQYVRVATERLEVLMNLAGELVVSRSRLMSRMDSLRFLQGEFRFNRHRLVERVEAFAEENEFSTLSSKQRRLTVVGQNAGRGSMAMAVGQTTPMQNDVAVNEAWSGFSELELDTYDDVNVLARSLNEISSDLRELDSQFSSEVRGLAEDSDGLSRIVTSIQGEITRARMVTVDSLFVRLRLAIRDAAEREHKEIKLQATGEEVAIDKTISDVLFAPMLHIVRNAVVHGIESPHERKKGGKDSAGTINLTAKQESGQIIIEVRDDGQGLNLPALHKKGIEMGLLPAGTSVDDESVKEMVFANGLSTKEEAHDVAGRGVGGDIVRRSIDRLNGTVQVSTQKGRGTLFRIQLPLTLAITRALLVRANNQMYAVPIFFMDRAIEAEAVSITESGGVRRISLEGSYMTVRRLTTVLGDTDGGGSTTGEGPIVVLRIGQRTMAIQVDSIVGQEEIVVKDMGQLLTGHPLLSGVTTRGTGKLALILDVAGMAETLFGRVTHGAGSDFGSGTADLPADALGIFDDDDTNAGEAYAAERDVHQDQSTGRARILFVDDSISVRKVAESVFRDLDVDLSVAVDGVDALEKLRADRFDMVFTDLEMPRMHGYELIRELKFIPEYKNLPIVVVSSRSAEKHQQQARQLGASDYIAKPFTKELLGSAMERWLKKG